VKGGRCVVGGKKRKKNNGGGGKKARGKKNLLYHGGRGRNKVGSEGVFLKRPWKKVEA